MFAMSFPALTGDVVMAGHARYCEANGHAYNLKNGIEQGWCPRCGKDNGHSNAVDDIYDAMNAECSSAPVAPQHDENGTWTVCKPSGWIVLRTYNGVGALAYAKALGYYVTRSR